MRCLGLLAFALVVVRRGAAITGFDTGSWLTNSFDVGSINNPDPRITPFHAQVFYPYYCSSQCGDFLKLQSKTLPVLVFATGFGATIATSDYSSLLNSIAAHGVVVVAVDRSDTLTITVDYSILAAKFVRVIDYIQGTLGGGNTSSLVHDLGNVPGSDTETPPNPYRLQVAVGTDSLFFGAHSSGNHITAQYVAGTVAASGCPNVAGFVMLSPLDGQDPLGFGGAQVIMPGQKINFINPAVTVYAQLDPVSSPLAIGVACAPSDRADDHFYNSWQGKIWKATGQSVGHLDLLDEDSTSSYIQWCPASTDATTRANYRYFLRGMVVSFIQGIWLSSPTYTGYMESTELMGTNVAIDLANQGSAVSGCVYNVWVNPWPYELQLGMTIFAIMFSVVFVGGLCCFFRRMDEDTVSKYLPTDIVDQDDSFQPYLQAHMDPAQYQHHFMQYSTRMDTQQSKELSQQYEQQYSERYQGASARVEV